MKVTIVTVWIHLIAIAIVFATVGCSTSQVKLIKEESELYQLKINAEMSIEEKIEAASSYCELDESPVFLDHAMVNQQKLDKTTLDAIRELNKKMNKRIKIAEEKKRIADKKTRVGFFNKTIFKKAKIKKMKLKITESNNLIVENSFRCLKISKL